MQVPNIEQFRKLNLFDLMGLKLSAEEQQASVLEIEEVVLLELLDKFVPNLKQKEIRAAVVQHLDEGDSESAISLLEQACKQDGIDFQAEFSQSMLSYKFNHLLVYYQDLSQTKGLPDTIRVHALEAINAIVEGDWATVSRMGESISQL